MLGIQKAIKPSQPTVKNNFASIQTHSLSAKRGSARLYFKEESPEFSRSNQHSRADRRKDIHFRSVSKHSSLFPSNQEECQALPKLNKSYTNKGTSIHSMESTSRVNFRKEKACMNQRISWVSHYPQHKISFKEKPKETTRENGFKTKQFRKYFQQKYCEIKRNKQFGKIAAKKPPSQTRISMNICLNPDKSILFNPDISPNLFQSNDKGTRSKRKKKNLYEKSLVRMDSELSMSNVKMNISSSSTVNPQTEEERKEIEKKLSPQNTPKSTLYNNPRRTAYFGKT
ncbi:unnamed protein product [Moneuplotes crassus]|uniref:Uncharacterized protein n=1 Tax=Euplotes crassus TaxID=5936 RepID=A0AAD1XH31_EUPCR|nr:unnamed protein product [Moneuplotes crassus]